MNTPVVSWWGFRRNELIYFLRWIHLSIHGVFCIGMNDEFVFAIDTSVDRNYFASESNHFEVYFLRLGWKAVNGGQYIVKDSFWMVYVAFFPGRFAVYFHVHIKRSCKSKKLIVFLWCSQDQKGTGGTDIYNIY